MKMFIFFVIILLSSCKSNTSHNNSIDNLIFSKDMTLDEFRINLKNYAENKPYPNIDN